MFNTIEIVIDSFKLNFFELQIFNVTMASNSWYAGHEPTLKVLNCNFATV